MWNEALPIPQPLSPLKQRQLREVIKSRRRQRILERRNEADSRESTIFSESADLFLEVRRPKNRRVRVFLDRVRAAAVVSLAFDYLKKARFLERAGTRDYFCRKPRNHARQDWFAGGSKGKQDRNERYDDACTCRRPISEPGGINRSAILPFPATLPIVSGNLPKSECHVERSTRPIPR